MEPDVLDDCKNFVQEHARGRQTGSKSSAITIIEALTTSYQGLVEHLFVLIRTPRAPLLAYHF